MWLPTEKSLRSTPDLPILAKVTQTVSLGFRKQLCINDGFQAKARDLDEACGGFLGGERCTWVLRSSDLIQLSEKEVKWCKYLPPVGEEERMFRLSRYWYVKNRTSHWLTGSHWRINEQHRKTLKISLPMVVSLTSTRTLARAVPFHEQRYHYFVRIETLKLMFSFHF